MICLVWPKIYMFFESRFKQRCWERRVGAGEEEWTFFSIQVSNIQEVFPDCNTFKGGKPDSAAFSQILRWSWNRHPSGPSKFNSHLQTLLWGMWYARMPGPPGRSAPSFAPSSGCWRVRSPPMCLSKESATLGKTQSMADIELILCFILQALDWVN